MIRCKKYTTLPTEALAEWLVCTLVLFHLRPLWRTVLHVGKCSESRVMYCETLGAQSLSFSLMSCWP